MGLITTRGMSASGGSPQNRNDKCRSSNAEINRHPDARPMALSYHLFFADCRAFQPDVLREAGAELLSERLAYSDAR